jgi:hypothetical protein
LARVHDHRRREDHPDDDESQGQDQGGYVTHERCGTRGSSGYALGMNLRGTPPFDTIGVAPPLYRACDIWRPRRWARSSR